MSLSSRRCAKANGCAWGAQQCVVFCWGPGVRRGGRTYEGKRREVVVHSQSQYLKQVMNPELLKSLVKTVAKDGFSLTSDDCTGGYTYMDATLTL
jgi:hypothetical protein